MRLKNTLGALAFGTLALTSQVNAQEVEKHEGDYYDEGVIEGVEDGKVRVLTILNGNNAVVEFLIPPTNINRKNKDVSCRKTPEGEEVFLVKEKSFTNGHYIPGVVYDNPDDSYTQTIVTTFGVNGKVDPCDEYSSICLVSMKDFKKAVKEIQSFPKCTN